MAERSCIICGVAVTAANYQVKTCSAECKRLYNLEYKRAYYAQFGRVRQQGPERTQYMREYTQRNAAVLREKKAAYREANRERLRQAEKDRLARDGELIRSRARARHEERRAALRLFHELQSKGLEALL